MKGILTSIIGLALIFGIAFVAALEYDRDVDRVLLKLELQQEAQTCQYAETLRFDMPQRVTDYCNDVIKRHDAIVKAYKQKQLQELITRIQETG